MRIGQWFSAALVVIGSGHALASCHSAAGQQGSETNWLGSCDSAAECPAGSCICRICTKECSSSGDCGGSETSCVGAEQAAYQSLCGLLEAPSAICVARCTRTAECSSGLSCRDGACVPERPAPEDSGAGETGTTGVDGSPEDAQSETCAGVMVSAEDLPLDAYLLVEASSAMSEPIPGTSTTFWDAVRAGIGRYAQDGLASGTAVGMQYFPLGVAPGSCDASYDVPDVELALLSDNAAELVSSIESREPYGNRPTGPALAGALEHMQTGAGTRPISGRAVIVITRGIADECSPQATAELSALARDAAEAGVNTYVIGIGTGLAGLNEVAHFGGTGQALLIGEGDVPTELAETLLVIGRSSPGCKFLIPEPAQGEMVLLALTSVTYVPFDGSATVEIPRVDGADACAENGGTGWYHDTENASTERILLCPRSCAEMPGSRIMLDFRCSPSTDGTP